jgi:hypothetical protein
LAASTAQHPKNSDTEPFPVGYNSTILELFVESLERWNDVQTLDAGPVCQENIIYFARRVKKHYACDMFIRLHRALGEQPKPGNFCVQLDYPDFSFDGIQLWDLIDHLDDDQAKLLLERCYDMLRPAGLLMLITSEKKPEPATINTLIIGRNYRLDLRPQRHLELPWYGRHNRALMSLLAEFTSVRLFRYRNGLREFLFKKPGPAGD